MDFGLTITHDKILSLSSFMYVCKSIWVVNDSELGGTEPGEGVRKIRRRMKKSRRVFLLYQRERERACFKENCSMLILRSYTLLKSKCVELKSVVIYSQHK